MGKKKSPEHSSPSFSRRGFLKAAVGAAGAAAVAPYLWIPNKAYAQTAARGAVKHLLLIRLRGGFRFTAVFNGGNAEEFSPFSAASTPAGTEWTPSELLGGTPWTGAMNGQQAQNAEQYAMLGMSPVPDFANEMATALCAHEIAGPGDGGHDTSLTRWFRGSLTPATDSFLTLVNAGLQARYAQALQQGKVLLPALVLGGDSGAALGFGQNAAYRPPVLTGSLDRFAFDPSKAVPAWATPMVDSMDTRRRERVHVNLKPTVDNYILTRQATAQFAAIFNDPSLKVSEGGNQVYDGIQNRELLTMLGNNDFGRQVATALRLFHHGCPAVYLAQGGYDYHSGEETSLRGPVEELARCLSATRAALRRMTHPDGGTYWDHTLVVMGGEMGRTTRGNRFNSARGSDHGGDLPTKLMTVPMMGGILEQTGTGGRSFGFTRPSDLQPQGALYTWRTMMKTFMDLLGVNHATFFPADPPTTDFFG